MEASASPSPSSSSSKQYFLSSLPIFFTLINVIFISKASAARPGAAAAAASRTGTIDTRFIRTSCGITTYPKLCFASLSSHASAIGSDPKLLAHAALSVSFETARSTLAMMIKLAKTPSLTPREVAAMREINDIQTWVSAALTDDDTCSDGFAGKSMSGYTKIAVRKQIVNVGHMTSNALALINSYASLHN